MPPAHARPKALANLIFFELPLTLDEHLQLLELIEQALAEEIVILPESNLIPWPDPEELSRLFERAVRRRHHKQA